MAYPLPQGRLGQAGAATASRPLAGPVARAGERPTASRGHRNGGTSAPSALDRAAVGRAPQVTAAFSKAQGRGQRRRESLHFHPMERKELRP
jgi:hypothetical protein